MTTLLRIAHWRWLALTGQETPVWLPGSAAWFVFPPLWHGIHKVRFVFREETILEPDLIALLSMISEGEVVLDVGANLGEWTIAMARRTGTHGRVIAFEPAREICRSLRQSVAANNLHQVTIVQKALSDKVGEAVLSYNTVAHTQNSLSPLGVVGEPVQTETLDSYLGQQSIGRIAVIKVDVEGWESQVLRGGLKTIRADKPIILFESNRRACEEANIDPEAASELLRRENYEFYRFNDRLGLSPVSSLPPELCNILAISRERSAN